MCENNSVRQIAKSNEGRKAKNGGVEGRDGSAEELDRETGEEQITVGWTRIKYDGKQTTEESGRVTRAGQDETSEGDHGLYGRIMLREMSRRQDRRESGRRRRHETEEGGKD